jgi:hypothetical protein
MGAHMLRRDQIKKQHALRRETVEGCLEQMAFMSGYALMGDHQAAIIEASQVADRLVPEKVVNFVSNLEQHVAKLLDWKD